MLRHIFYLVYLCLSLGLGLFTSSLCDPFFIFSFIFIVINHITDIPYWKKKSRHKILSVKKIVIKHFVTGKINRHFLPKNFFAWLSKNSKDTINTSHLFSFTNVIRCSKLPLWVDYFIYFKFTHVSSIVYQSLHLCSIKETNWLMNKRMCVLLFDVSKHLLSRKSDALVGKVNFSERKFEEMH